MKRCSLCKAEKDPGEFNRNKAKKDGLNDVCRSCSNARSATYYAENTGLHKKNACINRDRVRTQNQQHLLQLFECGCLDCGNKDVRVLEFDHRDPNCKRDNVSRMLGLGCGWATILKEVEKCDIVCANCHRIRTSAMFPNYRARSLTA